MFAYGMRRKKSYLYLIFPLIMSTALSARAETRYVAVEGMSIAPYTNWLTAASRIQDAVGVATSGDTVLVAPGRYGLYGTSVIVSASIEIQSTQGAEATVIDGTLSNRCVFLKYPTAVLNGFSIAHAPCPK